MSRFPRRDTPDSEKKEQYHKDYIGGIMKSSIDSSFYLSRQGVIENYNYFNNNVSGDEFEFLQKSEDGKSLPAIWLDFNKIRSKIMLLMGELSTRGYDISVQSINKEAKTLKYEFKKKMLARMAIKADNEMLAQISGISFETLTNVPNSLEELEEYMESSFKTNTEIIMESILRYNYEVYKWQYKRVTLWRSVLLSNRCFCINEWRNGYPQPRVVPPEQAVYDSLPKTSRRTSRARRRCGSASSGRRNRV